MDSTIKVIEFKVDESKVQAKSIREDIRNLIQIANAHEELFKQIFEILKQHKSTIENL